jgi:beta-glucosidase-like glycosyl hydrolase
VTVPVPGASPAGASPAGASPAGASPAAAARELAQLVIPAITWRAPDGFAHEQARLAELLALGVGGFLLVGGDQGEVRTLAKRLQRESRHPLLIAAELERGAGQQFAGATGLPPLAAIAALGDLESLRRAARLTAREARTMGVNWVLAPVADADLAPDNPVLGTRALSGDVARVGALAAAWVEACQGEGVLACAKHFPGQGRATVDPSLALPVVREPLDVLKEADLSPFRAVIGAGVASIMTAHIAYPALDPSGLPATLSREVLQWLLRQQLKYDQLVVTDVLGGGVLDGRDECEAAVMAVQAGCDLVLAPDDVPAVVVALEQAREAGRLDPAMARLALRRRLKWAQWASPPNEWRRPGGADAAWGALLADRCVRVAHGPLPPLAQVTEVLVVDDDRFVPGASPSRETLLTALRTAGVDARPTEAPTPASHGPLVLAVFGDCLPRKGRAWLSEETRQRVVEVLGQCDAARREVIVVAFGDPRLVEALGLARTTLFAWSADPVMQLAVARALVTRGEGRPGAPVAPVRR